MNCRNGTFVEIRPDAKTNKVLQQWVGQGGDSLRDQHQSAEAIAQVAQNIGHDDDISVGVALYCIGVLERALTRAIMERRRAD
jgi:hypothetical protein